MHLSRENVAQSWQPDANMPLTLRADVYTMKVSQLTMEVLSAEVESRQPHPAPSSR